MRVLVTGGTGFIGSHTVDLLLERGYEVTILDILQPRVHPRGKPAWVPREVRFIQGDVANPADLDRALRGASFVIHLAAYQDYLPDFSTFIHTNTESTALLFELIVAKKYPVSKIVFASSQSVAGEGRYACGEIPNPKYQIPHVKPVIGRQTSVDGDGHGVVIPGPRSLEQLRRGDWEIHWPMCGEYMQPLLIDEATINAGTTYAVSKYAIELLADRLGRRYGVPTVCMRYTYVQGSRNSFYNAYSGIARIFALRLMHGLPPICFEDGQQRRDYVNVKDVARANVLVLEDDGANWKVFNVGGKRPVTVLEFAQIMIKEFGNSHEPLVPGEFRLGDTRHTVSDVSALEALGWQPTIPVEQNVRDYAAWMCEQKVTDEFIHEADRIMREQAVVQRIADGR